MIITPQRKQFPEGSSCTFIICGRLQAVAKIWRVDLLKRYKRRFLNAQELKTLIIAILSVIVAEDVTFYGQAEGGREGGREGREIIFQELSLNTR